MKLEERERERERENFKTIYKAYSCEVYSTESSIIVLLKSKKKGVT